MNKWLKLPIVLITLPPALLVFLVSIFPLTLVSGVYVLLAITGFFGGGDPDKVPMFYPFKLAERYLDWLDSL